MIRQRRSLAALTVLVLLLTFGAVSQAWAANALVSYSYWAPLGAGDGTWAGPGSIPNPDGEPTPVSARGNAIAFADATHGWTVGYRLPVDALLLPAAPWVASTSDGGSSWSTTGTVLTDFAGYELRGVAAPDMGSVWAVGGGGLIIKRGFTDASWTQQSSGTTASLNAVAFASTTHGWAVGDGGVILATTNGSTWTAVTGVPAVNYYGVAVVDSTHVRVVGAGGTVAYWNGSVGWSSTTVSGSPVLRSASFIDANHGWVAGDGRTMRYTSNGCATWSTQTLPTPGDVTASPRSVAFSDSLRGIAVGGHETVWRTADGGAKWETEQFPRGESGWSGDILLTGVAYVPGNVGAPSTVWTSGYEDILLDPAAFAIKGTLYFAHTLTYGAGAGGKITGTSPQTVTSGGSGSQVTATPDTGYHFVSWSDGYPTAARTDSNVTADKSANASFAINTYTLTYGAGTGGTIVGTSPQTVNYNTSGTQVTATPNTGYHFVSWSDGYSTAARTDSDVTASKSVTASFAASAEVTWTLTYGAGAGGTIVGTNPQTVNDGGSGSQVTATPDTGYHFVSWSDQYPTAARTDSNVTADKSVTASFAADAPTPVYLPVYRFYNFKKGVHFYTADAGERANVIARLSNTYRDEGVAYSVNRANPENDTPLWRFYNFKKGVHFYTADLGEKNNVVAKLSGTYRLEGVAYEVCQTNVAGSKPVYRFYNFKKNTHFYTADEGEKNNVVAKLSSTYRLEGVAFYLAP